MDSEQMIVEEKAVEIVNKAINDRKKNMCSRY